MISKPKIKPSSTQIIMISFLFAILIGSVLLVLPISAKNGKSVNYLDALFTATTATCVTGLVTLPTVTTWSVFGQVVILVLIQIGGLGVITVLAGVAIAINKKLGLKDSALLQDSFNLNSLSGMSKFVKKVILGTLTVEGIGALAYMTVFVPEFGAKGIWISLFNSVSAFCNAGIDIIAENSLINYVTNPIVNAVTCILIVFGGLGYIVWWDIIRVLKLFKKEKFKCLRKLTLHSKIVIVTTLLLIFGGALLIFLFEYSNPLTLKGLSLFDKIQASFFQSVTTRTAGFATLPQEYLKDSTVIICIILMFVGGSPVGTAGGVKTVTLVVLIATTLSTVSGRDEVTLFNRDLSREITKKAVAVSMMSLLIVVCSTVLLLLVTVAPFVDVLYEAVSATATVGLTRNLTSSIEGWGKIILIITMYLGRVGPISLAVAFKVKKKTIKGIKNPTEEISVG